MIPKVKKIIDLTQPIFHTCPGWPTYKLTNVNMEGFWARDGFNAERVDMNTHTGTHLDAPYHFFPDGTTVEKMPLESFQGRGVVVDLRNIGRMPILASDLEPYADKIQKDDVVLLYTGWAQKRSMSKEYLFEWPYITKEAAEWLAQKEIRCVCIDGLSAGGWPEGTGAPPHIVLLGAGIVIIEEVYMDERLFEEDEWYITGYPLKLQGMGGSPCRVVATVFE